MNTPDLHPQTAAKLSLLFAAWPELTEVILYGSRAIGTAPARSDIDLATRGIKDERLLRRLALDLDDLDIPQKFDVQAYEKITHPPLKRHIDDPMCGFMFSSPI